MHFYAQKSSFIHPCCSPLAVADWISSWLCRAGRSSCLLFLGKAGKGTRGAGSGVSGGTRVTIWADPLGAELVEGWVWCSPSTASSAHGSCMTQTGVSGENQTKPDPGSGLWSVLGKCSLSLFWFPCLKKGNINMTRLRRMWGEVIA